MLQKIKNLFHVKDQVEKLEFHLSQIEKQCNENMWANIYHDSIRGYEELSLIHI